MLGDSVLEINGCFFDIRSTLVDESLCYQKRYNEIAESGNISKAEFESKVVEFARSKKNACHAAAEYYGLPIPKWHKELERLYPDTEYVLIKLYTKYKIDIIANQSLGSKERLEAWGIGKYIDIVIASAEAGIAKPDLNIFRIALKRADCDPKDAIMIGDRLDNDIVPAKKIGMQAIWIRQGFAAYQQLDHGDVKPNAVINSLSELLTILE